MTTPAKPAYEAEVVCPTDYCSSCEGPHFCGACGQPEDQPTPGCRWCPTLDDADLALIQAQREDLLIAQDPPAKAESGAPDV